MRENIKEIKAHSNTQLDYWEDVTQSIIQDGAKEDTQAVSLIMAEHINELKEMRHKFMAEFGIISLTAY